MSDQEVLSQDLESEFAGFVKGKNSIGISESFGSIYIDSIPDAISRIFEMPYNKIGTKSEFSNILIEDKNYIRSKYGLPDTNLPYSERRSALFEIARKNNIRIADRSEFTNFFKERNALAGGVSLDGVVALRVPSETSNDPLLTLEDETGDSMMYRLIDLEHEILHELQKIKYPRMSVLRMEYEAYLINMPDTSLIKSPFHLFVRVLLSLSSEQIREILNAN